VRRWVWLRRYPPPARTRFLSREERGFIAASLAEAPKVAVEAQPAPPLRWFALFSYREVLGLMTAKFLTDAGWYFFIFWLPKYLGDVRHLNIKEIGIFAWIPFAFSGAGSLLGGGLGGFLLR